MTINQDLKVLVSNAIATLGEAVNEVYGDKLFNVIESVRVRMKSIRAHDTKEVQEVLESIYNEFEEIGTTDLHKIAKSFSLMLELINTCEAAYRIYRLKSQKMGIEAKTYPKELIFVFTGHPTEARSKSFLVITHRIENLLLHALENDFDQIHQELLYLLKIGFKLNLANNKKPQVKDEAEHLIHIVLDRKILQEQIYLKKENINVLFRTWVGGDKDGNPNVGAKTMLECLSLSRKKLTEFFISKLDIYLSDISITHESPLIDSVLLLKKDLRIMSNVTKNDGSLVKVFLKDFKVLCKKDKSKKLNSPNLKELQILLELYPALVLPLEIREDSELIHTALKNPKQEISKMLLQLKSISTGLDPKWYVRGFIISMCQESADLLAAAKLIKKTLGQYKIPAVPLFENEKGLSNSIQILTESFEKFPFFNTHQKLWESRFEVMLGYSDSSKENGVVPGRLLLEKALYSLDKFLINQKFIPVFFHGSGGSLSRGGGSVKDQVSWWPKSAIDMYKVTIQGEMVQRQFHHPLIMRSQVKKIVVQFNDHRQTKVTKSEVVTKFSTSIQHAYREIIKDEDFRDLISKVTPYHYLNLLKIGSRPSKRSQKGKFSLRAIPWILCWTQTRLLLPIWWGVGSSWKDLSLQEKNEFCVYSASSPILQTYIKNLGFTLAKVELGVWKFHVHHSALSEESQKRWNMIIENELELVKDFFNDVTNKSDYTWFRPILGESIMYRSSMIHPLNIIQKISLERNDQVLLRETVTGIACGMLTTG
jgi:phosphoenolpyruvate carboxylase